MFQQIFQRRHIITDFRHFRIMVKVGISCLPVALLGHNYHAQSLRRVTAILVRRDTSNITTSASCSMAPLSRNWLNSGRRSICPSAKRFNWLNSTTGTFNSLASIFAFRVACATSAHGYGYFAPSSYRKAANNQQKSRHTPPRLFSNRALERT